jgi:GNAT superfamily N-acetyltransferase
MVAQSEIKTRPLGPSDLDRVVEIDQHLVGRSRRGFFEKRLEAAIAVPEDFVVVGVDNDDGLCAFAFARISTGDFGLSKSHAVLDAIGVDPACQSKGMGHGLMGGLDKGLRKRGVGEIRTQTDWRFHDVIRFLDAEGFKAAPILILERPTTSAL